MLPIEVPEKKPIYDDLCIFMWMFKESPVAQMKTMWLLFLRPEMDGRDD